MQRATMPSLWHCEALWEVWAPNGIARALHADKRRLWIGAWTLDLGWQKIRYFVELRKWARNAIITCSGKDACKKLIGIRQMG